MIRFTIASKPAGGPVAVTDSLKKYRDRLHRNVATTVRDLGVRLVSIAKDKHLSGPRPSKLGVVTGRLRNSINAIVTEEGDTLELRFGTNVPYARAHEQGFHGTVQVPAHIRRIKTAFGRNLKTPVNVLVGGHTRRVDLKARPFLAPSMAANKAWLGKQIRDILRGGGPS